MTTLHEDIYVFLQAKQVKNAETHILHPTHFIRKSYCF
jgi:hypothetical protein